jgi:hypothetical protein
VVAVRAAQHLAVVSDDVARGVGDRDRCERLAARQPRRCVAHAALRGSPASEHLPHRGARARPDAPAPRDAASGRLGRGVALLPPGRVPRSPSARSNTTAAATSGTTPAGVGRPSPRRSSQRTTPSARARTATAHLHRAPRPCGGDDNRAAGAALAVGPMSDRETLW